METTTSLEGMDPTVLSQLQAARAATAKLAEERRKAEQSARHHVAESEAALREASEVIQSYPNEGTATSSDSCYGPPSHQVSVTEDKDVDDVFCCTPESEGLSTGNILEFDENGMVVIRTSSSCIPQRIIRERRRRGMRIWRAGDGAELIRGIVDALTGCFHGMLAALGMRRRAHIDEAMPLVGRSEV